MCCLYLIFKRRISHESSEFSKKGDHIWSAFWGMANLCNVPGLREQEAAHWNCSHSCRRILLGNRQGLFSWTQTHWGWCLFIELNILCNLEAPKLLLWRLGKVHFALVVQTRNVLLFPDISKKDSPAKSDHSSTENTFGMPSKQRKHSATHQCSGEEETAIGVFAIMIWKFDVGKRPGWLCWTKWHWGWSLYKEVNEWSIHVACYLVYSGDTSLAIMPCLNELAIWSFPCLCKQDMVCPIWHLQKGEPFWSAFQAMEIRWNKPGHRSQEVPLWYLCPNYRRSLAVKNAMDDFLSKVRVGLGCIHSFDDTVEPGIFQILGCGVCEMALLPWMYEVALCWFFLIWKEGILLPNQTSPQRRFSLEWLSCDGNSVHTTSAQRARGNILVYFLQCVREFEEGKRQGLHSWAKMHLGSCLFIELNTHCHQVTSNLLLVMFG